MVMSLGELVHRFLGFCEPVERGVTGYVQCIVEASKAVLSWHELMKVASSVVTDGESLNSGDRNGLRRKLEEEKVSHDPSHGPMLKIWCAAHRSNLAYKDVSKSVSEAKLITSDVVAVGSYFHVSGVRTHELKEAAVSNGLQNLFIGQTSRKCVLLSSVTICLPYSFAIAVAVFATGRKEMIRNPLGFSKSGRTRTGY